jgi:signal transduction histidine kinase
MGSLFHFFSEHALEMVISFDEDGRIVYANSAAKTYLEYEEGLEGYKISDIFQADFPEEGMPFWENHAFAGEIVSLSAYRKNHTCFSVKAKLIKSEENPTTWHCLALDDTDRTFFEKRAVQSKQEADDALKVKSEFVANVTHELRTPVNALLANTTGLLEKEENEEKIEVLKRMERGCRDMNLLINNILDFSKMEAGKFILEPREFDVKNMLDYVKSNHISKITEKGLDFFITMSPEVPGTIIGDELRIGQILNNLISNATKFTTVGKITVEVVKTAQVGDRVELFFIVIDTGIGIDKSEQDKLFQSFSQVDASISRKYGGTGLGLNICKQLVELMDGSIHVESEYHNGSIFSFNIWVGLPQEEVGNLTENADKTAVMNEARKLSEGDGHVWTFGEKENTEELNHKMSKLILCIEMRNWEKAEMFADMIKKLTNQAPQEIKMAALRLKMAVQKSNYETSVECYDGLKAMLKESEGIL